VSTHVWVWVRVGGLEDGMVALFSPLSHTDNSQKCCTY
jgi:hypothetical protein